MDLKFKVLAIVSRPVHDVFEAVADPGELSAYFTTGGAEGRLEAGKTVEWDFADFPGAFPVEVVEVVPDAKIVLRWEAHDGDIHAENPEIHAGYTTLVTMTFTALDGDTRTKVEIAEEGWRQTPAGLQASYNNCAGWAQMLAALKMWVEHGINLRDGIYK